MNKNITTLILAIIVITPMILFELYSRWDYSNQKKLYTISESTKYRGIRGRSDLTVRIEYNKEFYNFDWSVPQSCIKRVQRRERFLVEFSEKNPNSGTILCDYIIPDSISKTEVWDSIPSFLKKIKE
jgi:hypothetical protein